MVGGLWFAVRLTGATILALVWLVLFLAAIGLVMVGTLQLVLMGYYHMGADFSFVLFAVWIVSSFCP
jgi:hypothetical protein